MHRHLCLACLAVGVAAGTLGASAQTFPAPGTGVYTWQPVATPPPPSSSVMQFKPRAIGFGPTGTAYCASDTVYIYEPAPEGPPAGRWRRLGYPRLGIDAILPLDPAGDTLLVGRGTMTRSTDGGVTWADVNGTPGGSGSGGPDYPGGFLVLPPGHPRAGRILAGSEPVFSDDRGATWHDAALTPGLDAGAHAFAVLPSGRVLFSGYYGVAATDDGGASYAATPFFDRYIADGLTALATPGSTQAGAPACGLADLSRCDGAVVVGTEAGADGVQAWRTADGGRSWTGRVALRQPYDGIGYDLVAGVVSVGRGADGLGRAVAVLGRGLVYATADGGQTWAAVGRMPLDLTQGTHVATYAVLGPDGHLWAVETVAGTEAGAVYRSAERAEAAFPVAGEVGPETGEAAVTVRPNPASGRAEIVLRLAGAGAARVVVVDALGREVAVVLDGPVRAGETVASVETGAWPPGVYVVRATAGVQRATARLVVGR